MSTHIAPTEEELRAFVGPRADRFSRKWRRAIDQGSNLAGIVLPAVFLNYVWFLYRRMFREAWLAFGLVVIVSIFRDIYESGHSEGYTLPVTAVIVINVCTAVATSVLASYLYLRKLRRTVADVRRAGMEPDTAAAWIRSKGGTSMPAALIGAVLGITFLGLSLWMATAVD